MQFYKIQFAVNLNLFYFLILSHIEHLLDHRLNNILLEIPLNQLIMIKILFYCQNKV